MIANQVSESESGCDIASFGSEYCIFYSLNLSNRASRLYVTSLRIEVTSCAKTSFPKDLNTPAARSGQISYYDSVIICLPKFKQ